MIGLTLGALVRIQLAKRGPEHGVRAAVLEGDAIVEHITTIHIPLVQFGVNIHVIVVFRRGPQMELAVAGNFSVC